MDDQIDLPNILSESHIQEKQQKLKKKNFSKDSINKAFTPTYSINNRKKIDLIPKKKKNKICLYNNKNLPPNVETKEELNTISKEVIEKTLLKKSKKSLKDALLNTNSVYNLSSPKTKINKVYLFSDGVNEGDLSSHIQKNKKTKKNNLLLIYNQNTIEQINTNLNSDRANKTHTNLFVVSKENNFVISNINKNITINSNYLTSTLNKTITNDVKTNSSNSSRSILTMPSIKEPKNKETKEIIGNKINELYSRDPSKTSIKNESENKVINNTFCINKGYNNKGLSKPDIENFNRTINQTYIDFYKKKNNKSYLSYTEKNENDSSNSLYINKSKTNNYKKNRNNNIDLCNYNTVNNNKYLKGSVLRHNLISINKRNLKNKIFNDFICGEEPNLYFNNSQNENDEQSSPKKHKSSESKNSNSNIIIINNQDYKEDNNIYLYDGKLKNLIEQSPVKGEKINDNYTCEKNNRKEDGNINLNNNYIGQNPGDLLLYIKERCAKNDNFLHSTIKGLINHNFLENNKVYENKFLEKLKPEKKFDTKRKMSLYKNKIKTMTCLVYDKLKKIIKNINKNYNHNFYSNKSVGNCSITLQRHKDIFVVLNDKVTSCIIKSHGVKINNDYESYIENEFRLFNENFASYINKEHFDIRHVLIEQIFSQKLDINSPRNNKVHHTDTSKNIKSVNSLGGSPSKCKNTIIDDTSNNNKSKSPSLHRLKNVTKLLHSRTKNIQNIFNIKNMSQILYIIKKDLYYDNFDTNAIYINKDLVQPRRLIPKRVTNKKKSSISPFKVTKKNSKTVLQMPLTSKASIKDSKIVKQKNKQINPFKDDFFIRPSNEDSNIPIYCQYSEKDSAGSLSACRLIPPTKNNKIKQSNSSSYRKNYQNVILNSHLNQKHEISLFQKHKVPLMQGESVLCRTYEIKANIVNNFISINDVLFFYIKDGNVQKFIELMKKHDISKDIRDKDGNTLLILAVQANSKEIIEFLLSKNFDVNDINIFNKNTALHYAFAFRNFEISDLLINNGADESAKNADGLTPWELLQNNN